MIASSVAHMSLQPMSLLPSIHVQDAVSTCAVLPGHSLLPHVFYDIHHCDTHAALQECCMCFACY